MTRYSAFLFIFAFIGCRGWQDSDVDPVPPELVTIGLNGYGDRLTFMLPDAGWHQVDPERASRGLLYERGGRSLQVEILFKEDYFDEAVSEARRRETGAEVRSLILMPVWPFTGVIVVYRGPPDAPMLDAFTRSFKVERR